MAGIHLRGRGRGWGRGNHFNQLQMWDSQHGQFANTSYINCNPDTGCFKLYVRSIPRTYSKTTLLNIFKKVSPRATVTYLHSPPPGVFVTWAFVEYPTYSEAKLAIEQLNNNVVLDNIEVAFAREKPSEYFDIGSEEEEELPMAFLNHSITTPPIPPIDPKTITKTVMNDQALGVTRNLDNYYLKTHRPEIIKRIEENLFQKILKIHKEEALSGKCAICGASTALACSMTCLTFYCSEDCQARDWPKHSESCKTGNENGSERGSKTDLRAGGDASPFSNGHGAVQSERLGDQFNFKKPSSSWSESSGRVDKGQSNSGQRFNGENSRGRDNRQSDSNSGQRFNRDNSRGRDNRQSDSNSGQRFNRDNSRGRDNHQSDSNSGQRFNGDNSRGRDNRQSDSNSGQRFNRDNSRGRDNDRQNDSASGQRNMFEERKSRFANQNKVRTDNFADERNQSAKNNVPVQPTPDWHVPTQALRRQAAPKKPEGKLTTGSEFIFKEQQFLSKPEEPKSISSAPQPTVKPEEPKSISSAPQPTVKPEEPKSIPSAPQPTVKPEEPKSIPSGPQPTVKPEEPKSIPSAPQPTVDPAVSLPSLLREGVVEEVEIAFKELDGVYYVLPINKLLEFNSVCMQLNDVNYTTFTPVQGAICVASYELTWSRCRVTCLDPLTVQYIDFGNYETTTADKLFSIPPELASIPPFAVKIKLAAGTPTEYLNKTEGEILSITPIEKAGDHWVVQVAGTELTAVSPTVSVQPAPPTVQPAPPIVQVVQSTDSAAASTVVAPVPASTSSSPDPTVVSAPRLLAANEFTEVFLQHRSLVVLAVTPVQLRSQLSALMDSIQRFQALSSPSIRNLEPGLKCLVRSPTDGNWCRGRVIKLDPLAVRFVDFGNTEAVSSVDIRELPEAFAKDPPFVTYVKPKDETPTHFTKGDVFAVKPLYKESTMWVVEVASVASTESGAPPSTSNGAITSPAVKPVKLADSLVQPPNQSQTVSSSTSNCAITTKQQASTEFPKMFKADSYSTVVNTHPVSADSFCVGEPSIFNALTEMNQYFLASDPSSKTLNATLGALGIALFEEVWYRVKVVCMEPLSVKYIDFGNVELISPNDFKTCPETHKDVPPLVHQITLAPGTPKKFYDLPIGSELSIKPITKLPDETVVVQIEGQTYETEGGSSVAAPSISEQLTNQAIPPQVPASHQQQETPADNRISELRFSAEMLQEGWTAKFMPTHLNFSRDALCGYLYSDMIPSTKDFMLHFDAVMEKEVHDPAYQVLEGAVVGYKQDNEWYRVQLSSEQLLVLVDIGSVDHGSGNYFRLPDRFSTTAVPLLAATITIDSINKQLLRELAGNAEITLSVKEVSAEEVKVTLQEGGVCGLLKKWRYDPLAVPDPLGPLTLVTIGRVMQSNSFLLKPANDIKAEQIIQVECRKNAGKQLQNPPKVGDHVAYFLKEVDMFCRSRIVKIDVDKNEYELFNIDLGTKVSAKLEELNPLSNTLRKLPCRLTLVELKDVVLTELTPEAKIYISSLVENEKILRIEYETEWNTATLTLDEGGETVNSTLNQLLTPVIKPDNFGKYMLNSIQESNPPRNQELKVVITQVEPLYVQMMDQLPALEELFLQLQEHGAEDKVPYNPCTHELCLVNFEGEWYRSVCLMETPKGVSPHQLLDYGSMAELSTEQVRRIHPDMLKMPIAAIACKIHGLPNYQDCSQELKARLNTLLKTDSVHSVSFDTEPTPDKTYFMINVPKVIETLKSEGLL